MKYKLLEVFYLCIVELFFLLLSRVFSSATKVTNRILSTGMALEIR